MNWVKEILDQHSELESPESFWYWSALSAISAVVKDQIWISKQIYNLYPNIYVMLHADSGMKKGPPVSMARQLVKPVNNTRIIEGRSSIQGILKELGTGQTQPGGKVQTKSVAFICSSELTSSIVEDKVALKILTDLYDRQYRVGEWRSLLKMETFELRDPTITMLTATNESMSDDFLTKAAIRGGYIARTFMVYEKETSVINSLIYRLQNPPNYTSSAEYLKVLSKLTGAFHPLEGDKSDEYRYKKIKHTKKGPRELYFNAVGIRFDDWYDDFCARKRQETRDVTGTLNRFDDSVLKVAMLLSLANEPKLIISEEAVEEAIVQCERLLGNVRSTTLGTTGLSEAWHIKTTIIKELLGRQPHQITRTMLMSKLWADFKSASEFDDIMAGFDGTGMIKTQNIGNQIVYYVPDGQAEEMKQFLAGKGKSK